MSYSTTTTSLLLLKISRIVMVGDPLVSLIYRIFGGTDRIEICSGWQVLENWLDRAGFAEFFFHTDEQSGGLARGRCA
jgi:hypothetical protein